MHVLINSGGQLKGAGRKTISKTIRWNPAEWSEVKAAADAFGETTSEFIRKGAQDRAREA